MKYPSMVVRLELEKEGLFPFCYGASLNVFLSSMARPMSNGRFSSEHPEIFGKVIPGARHKGRPI